jgi:hypothetical protein
MRDGYKHIVIPQEIFSNLYYELSNNRAALKDDCIEYAIYSPGKSVRDYPEWFYEAYKDGYIYNEDGYDHLIFYSETGNTPMTPGAVVLKNFMGQVNYMERNEFEKYYDITGGIRDEY